MELEPSLLAQLSVTYLKISDLKPYERNSRRHSKAQIRQIAESIKEFGFTNPALIDKNNVLIAGHGRVEAAILASCFTYYGVTGHILRL